MGTEISIHRNKVVENPKRLWQLVYTSVSRKDRVCNHGRHTPVHGSLMMWKWSYWYPIYSTDITEHLPSKNQNQHFIYVLSQGFHQFPGLLRRELPCTDISHF